MLDAIRSYFPAEWGPTIEFLGAPLWWIPDWQATVWRFSLIGLTPWDALLRWLFLALPATLVVVGTWVTMASLYTLPFRAQRGRFLTTVVMTWWDAARSVWLFWAGVVRLVVVVIGWLWGLARLFVRLVVGLVKGAFTSPFVLLDWTSRRYFQPGVPWIAFLLTILWSGLEATIFTYTLQPTLIEVLAAITGFEPSRAVVTPILWILLFLLIAGSFACVEVLAQAIRAKEAARIGQMLFVEFFVMFFEVMFLYRELVDAITPWIAQQTGGELQLGLASTLGLAAFGWLGIRGMTWFLFARYGTPALLAVLSRETITREGAAMPVEQAAAQPNVWRDAVAAFKAETSWFKKEGQYVFELLTLPILQLLAAAVNFPVVAVRSVPAFRLPFKRLDDVLQAAPFAAEAEALEGAK